MNTKNVISIDLSVYDKDALIDIILYSIDKQMPVDQAIVKILKEAVDRREVLCQDKMVRDWDASE